MGNTGGGRPPARMGSPGGYLLPDIRKRAQTANNEDVRMPLLVFFLFPIQEHSGAVNDSLLRVVCQNC